MRFFKAILFALPFFLLLLPEPVNAQTCSLLTWAEVRTRSFAFIYQESVPLGAEIASDLGDQLDAEFNRFANLFGRSISLPISVRVYPNERDYYCFNALAPLIPRGQTHSRIGSREIALIADNINADRGSWDLLGLDALRFELASLFIHNLTDGKAPPGIEIGIGVYAQDPFVSFERRLATSPPPLDTPGISWRELWESPDLLQSPEQALQNASIVAYLVDVYGWEKFIQFLDFLRTSEGFREALSQAYEIEAGALEDQWESTFYPLFFEGRWRTNALYALSLTPFEQLIAAGAYQAAADGLFDVISLLVDLNDVEKLFEAQALNQLALIGLEGDALARLARQAYLEADFEAAAGFARAAQEKYDGVGDSRNQAALIQIAVQAEEVLELRAELMRIQEDQGGSAGISRSARLIEIGSRLAVLNDQAGVTQVSELLARINSERKLQATWISITAAVLGIGILFHRITLSRRKAPPETQLQYE